MERITVSELHGKLLKIIVEETGCQLPLEDRELQAYELRQIGSRAKDLFDYHAAASMTWKRQAA